MHQRDSIAIAVGAEWENSRMPWKAGRLGSCERHPRMEAGPGRQIGAFFIDYSHSAIIYINVVKIFIF
jgi:hypothetical protein